MAEVFLVLSRVGEVAIDLDPTITDLNVEVISIKGKSPSQLLASLADMYELKVTETSKGGIRVSALDKNHLQKLTINPAVPEIEVSYNGVTSDVILHHVVQAANLNIILPRLPHSYSQSFAGKFAPLAIINDVAEMEGVDVMERDGVIYFKLPKN